MHALLLLRRCLSHCTPARIASAWSSRLRARRVPPGEEAPKGRDALGWRIAVYWKDDRLFYEGRLNDYEPATGRHKVCVPGLLQGAPGPARLALAARLRGCVCLLGCLLACLLCWLARSLACWRAAETTA